MARSSRRRRESPGARHRGSGPTGGTALILDANVHATLDGRWLGTSHDASVQRLITELDAAEVERAVLTGIPGALPTEAVLEICGCTGGRLIPVGCLEPGRHDTPEAAVAAASVEFQDAALPGVKLHPRLSRCAPSDPRVAAILAEMAQWNPRPVVWVCTFLHIPGLALQASPVEALCELVWGNPELTFVLCHAGGPDLLRLATALRSSPNALLDVSYTLTRFRGSSVELDLRYLTKTFARRLVFGSDFPEVSVRDAKAAMADVLAGVSEEAAARIWSGNLASALGIDLDAPAVAVS